MKRQSFLIFVGALALVGGGGCRPAGYEPLTQAEAQETYSRTKWYFARLLAFSKLVPELGDAVADNNRTQICFQLASGTRINYQEFLPGGGIKARGAQDDRAGYHHSDGKQEPAPHPLGVLRDLG